MKFAILGTGYVADFYMASLKYHPILELKGAYDIDRERAEKFSSFYNTNLYSDFDELLNDQAVELVLNLTNPREHFETTKRCLFANKHVYSEKPLSMEYESAKELVELARKRNLYLSSAPCSMLGETAQTMWKALDDKLIGDVKLIYANFDAGMTHKQKPWNWISVSGANWPAKDEFEVGCTYEHAGYFLTWLAAFFGPAKKVTSVAASLIPDKGIQVDVDTPDTTIGCIEYENNVLARVTSTIVAPLDKSLTIVGDKGILYIKDLRDDSCPVYFRRTPPGRLEGALEYRLDFWMNSIERVFNWLPWIWGNHWRINRKLKFAQKPAKRSSGKYKPVDFCRGPAEMAHAIKEARECRLSAELGLHITEIIEVLQYPERFNGSKALTSSFSNIKPLPLNK